MTPFNADALLVMLLTFYPIVGPAALARARLERPDYFAGGEIRGTKGDKLWLPDGRKYDLILATGSPGQRWQILGPLPDAGDAPSDDVFALEAGPLTPIDESAWPDPAHDPIFAPLVAGALHELDTHDTALGVAHATMAAAADEAVLDNALGGDVDHAESQIAGHHRLLDQADPSDILGTTAGHGAVIDANESAFPTDAPGELDPNPPPFPNFPPDVQTPTPDTQ